MSGAPLRRSNARVGRFRRALPVAGLIVMTVACTGESRGRRILGKATPLYEQGKYAEALPLFQQARDAGLQDGVLLYQLGFCREAVEGKPEGRREVWKEAEPLLVREIGQKDGATLERLYDLAVIHSDRQEWDAMNQYALQGIEQYEKGPDPNALTGQDWFRLGRLHDLVNELSESEAAYRRSVSAFAKTQGGSAIYRSLALAKVAELDLQMARYPVAAERFDEALKLFPANSQVRPFLHGLALLGAHRYEEATKRFAADTSETNTESQYGADLARKASIVAPLDDKDIDGIPLETIPIDVLQERVLQAAKDFRSAREKNSYRPGDPLPAEVAMYQKRFAALTGEYFMRTRAMQDFCMEKGIADLVRR